MPTTRRGTRGCRGAALFGSWLLVLPEYILNVSAIRYGHGTFTGGQMAAMNLSSGVVCVALVARYFLGEKLSRRQILGFVLMTLGVVLVVYR
ncbi:MAG: DMT family protein [Deltaproteobacteria bacterium]|nr:DMT family protein [Deltaproteobacteria bacterium]